MLLLSINSIFAYIFLRAAAAAFERALPFMRSGWTVIGAEVKRPGFRQDVERLRRLENASSFLIGGIGWLLAGLIAGGAGLMFAWQSLRILLNLA